MTNETTKETEDARQYWNAAVARLRSAGLKPIEIEALFSQPGFGPHAAFENGEDCSSFCLRLERYYYDATGTTIPQTAPVVWTNLLLAARAIFTTPGYVETRDCLQDYVAKTALAGLRDALEEFGPEAAKDAVADCNALAACKTAIHAMTWVPDEMAPQLAEAVNVCHAAIAKAEGGVP